MHPDLQRRVQRYGWDNAAPYYEDLWKKQLLPAQQRLLEMAELQPGERVLDVACGSGLVSFPAAAAVAPAGRVVGVDISDRMVEIASESAAHRGLSVEFIRMDAESLDFPDNSFDAVLCGLGLMYVPDPISCLREMHRVLGSGKRAVTAVWGRRDRCGWAEVFPIVDRRVASEVCPMFFQLGTGDASSFAFDEAGFDDIHLERMSVILHYASEEEACAAVFAGGPVALA
ncbi:MAG: methyltransferase domain-containing protein, partial [Rhodothermia bacterium]|nr:methyltransferase domain-containing protein [Rhodothermia bacterium]